MQASIVDLRYKMHDVLKALDRNEKVMIMFHGKKRGVICPLKTAHVKKVGEHAFFGMYKDDKETVAEVMQKLRGNRYENI